MGRLPRGRHRLGLSQRLIAERLVFSVAKNVGGDAAVTQQIIPPLQPVLVPLEVYRSRLF